ncbi:MAG: flagellar basal body P-ring formation chaperone FlgA [Chthoniobacter sp.]|nr:flagellar basal body P-ring formation chaperone FlgA [Chthoniobacter sp.]
MRLILGLAVLNVLLASTGAQIDNLLVPVRPPTTDNRPEIRSPEAGSSPAATERQTLLSGEAFAAELTKELAARMSLKGELKLSLTRAWQPVQLPEAEFAIAIVTMPANGLSGSFTLRVKVTSGGRLISDCQVSVAAELWQDAWVASSRLDRGQPLSADQLSLQKVDVLRERLPLVSAEIDPTALDLVTSVAAGRPLARRDVAGRPIIRKGQVVEVVAQQGLIAISMKALALESGAAGDLIRLRNIESRREINGEIVNESKVQIHF